MQEQPKYINLAMSDLTKLSEFNSDNFSLNFPPEAPASPSQSEARTSLWLGIFGRLHLRKRRKEPRPKTQPEAGPPLVENGK
jgi:hypothetical protein